MCHYFMGYRFFIACVQISFISFVVDIFLPFTSLLRYQELHFQIPSPVLLSPCYQQKQIGIPQQNKLYLLHFSLFSRDTIYNNAKTQLWKNNSRALTTLFGHNDAEYKKFNKLFIRYTFSIAHIIVLLFITFLIIFHIYNLLLKVISIGNSMICSDIRHKYHEWYFEIVIRNFTSH